MARNLNNWMRAWMEFTRETESPDCYHFWSALTLIGAATKRQVYLDMHHFRVYPNFYTILVGPSGARKSVSAGIAMNVAYQSGIKKFSQKITTAALIKELADSTEKLIIGGEVEFYTPLLIYSSELGVFMGADAYSSGLIGDLTDLYDCPPQWQNKTIIRGAEPIMGPYISMLAASTPQTLKDVIPSGAIGQGFTSRVLFVWAGGRRKRIPLPVWESGHTMLEKELIHDLKEISQVRGLFKFDDAGYSLYRRNYLDRPEPEDEFEDERLRGYSSRKDIHTLKVAMCLSLADKDGLVLTEKDIAGAADAIKWLDQGLQNVFAGHGTSARAEDAARVFKQIDSATKRMNHISHQELMKRNYYYLNAIEFQTVLDTLMQAGAIEERVGIDPRTGKQERFFQSRQGSFLNQIKSIIPKKMTTEEED